MNINSQKIIDLASDKPVAIFGAGLSGRAVENLLQKLSIKSVIYAQDTENHFTESCADLHKLVVYSPAFRPDNEWIKLAEQHGLECICETDLSALAWNGKIIAITGTNGKTTLTKFLTHALNYAGKTAIAVGNIGTPLSQICANSNYDTSTIAVYELSSFQTSKLKYLSPDALLWTNFDSDHLDWHRDLHEYFSAKFNIVHALTNNIFVAGSSVETYAKKFDINLPKFTKIFNEQNKYVAPAPFSSGIQARNYQAVKLLWEELSLDEQLLLEACKTFELPQFRFANATKIGNVKFYNDSKATNAHAAIAAINELANKANVVWLGGGKDKLCDLSELVENVCKHCSSAVLIGQTSEKLKELFNKKNFHSEIASNMNIAVEKAYTLAKEDGSVIFSPAFSSFGMFANYVERGKSFQNAVLCLKNTKKL